MINYYAILQLYFVNQHFYQYEMRYFYKMFKFLSDTQTHTLTYVFPDSYSDTHVTTRSGVVVNMSGTIVLLRTQLIDL